MKWKSFSTLKADNNNPKNNNKNNVSTIRDPFLGPKKIKYPRKSVINRAVNNAENGKLLFVCRDKL